MRLHYTACECLLPSASNCQSTMFRCRHGFHLFHSTFLPRSTHSTLPSSNDSFVLKMGAAPLDPGSARSQPRLRAYSKRNTRLTNTHLALSPGRNVQPSKVRKLQYHRTNMPKLRQPTRHLSLEQHLQHHLRCKALQQLALSRPTLAHSSELRSRMRQVRLVQRRHQLGGRQLSACEGRGCLPAGC